MATGGASDLERGTDEIFDNLCSVCSRKNNITEGSEFCIDCQQYFCSICVDFHDDFPALRNHQILNKAKLIQVKNSKKYSVRGKSDTDGGCFIQSICELDDGTIILSDSNQNKLKRLDSSYMVRDSCEVSWPRQVCTINSQEVALCCDLGRLIQFVSIGHAMQKTWKIKTDFMCSGLAYNDEKLFISDEFPTVYVYTLTGERLQQLNKPWFFVKLCAEKKFDLTSIAVSSDGSTIYISHSSRGLIILNRNGQLVGEINNHKLRGARGVCLYKNNIVLVCGMYSKNVLQFTPNGKLIGQVLKRDKGCYALCYCKKTSELIVGLGNEIEVH